MGLGLPVTREEIRRIAALAELAVDDATAAELEVQLGRILDYVRQLDSLEEGPVATMDERGVALRPDVVGSDPLARPPHDFAPAMRDDLFLVPRVGEAGGAAGEA